MFCKNGNWIITSSKIFFGLKFIFGVYIFNIQLNQNFANLRLIEKLKSIHQILKLKLFKKGIKIVEWWRCSRFHLFFLLLFRNTRFCLKKWKRYKSVIPDYWTIFLSTKWTEIDWINFILQTKGHSYWMKNWRQGMLYFLSESLWLVFF